MHVLFDQQDAFPDNCGQFSDEQGERSHQELMTMELSYSGKDIRNALGDYCWRIMRDKDPATYKRQSKNHKKTRFFVRGSNNNEAKQKNKNK